MPRTKKPYIVQQKDPKGDWIEVTLEIEPKDALEAIKALRSGGLKVAPLQSYVGQGAKKIA